MPNLWYWALLIPRHRARLGPVFLWAMHWEDIEQQAEDRLGAEIQLLRRVSAGRCSSPFHQARRLAQDYGLRESSLLLGLGPGESVFSSLAGGIAPSTGRRSWAPSLEQRDQDRTLFGG